MRTVVRAKNDEQQQRNFSPKELCHSRLVPKTDHFLAVSMMLGSEKEQAASFWSSHGFLICFCAESLRQNSPTQGGATETALILHGGESQQNIEASGRLGKVESATLHS